MRQFFFMLCAASLAAALLCGGAFASSKTPKVSLAKQTTSVKAEAKRDLVLSGKVVETMNAGGYTYVCLGKKGKKTWVAVPEMKVTVGQKIGFQPGMEMINFTSKSLNRTFERIIFSGGPLIRPAGGGKNPSAVPGSGEATTAPSEKIIAEKETGSGAANCFQIF